MQLPHNAEHVCYKCGNGIGPYYLHKNKIFCFKCFCDKSTKRKTAIIIGIAILKLIILGILVKGLMV